MQITAYQLCSQALKKCGAFGVGQTPLAEDINDAFLDLKMMIGLWQRKRWNVYHLVDNAITSTGALAYTVGPGGDFNLLSRPDKIDAAFVRLQASGSPTGSDFNVDFDPSDFGGGIVAPNPAAVDYPLTQIPAREDYNLIAVKGLGSFPDCYYYDAVYPLGVVYFYPVPAATTYELHITTKEVLGQALALTNDINLPDEYYEALLYNLCVRLRPSYQLPPDPTLSGLASAAINTIKGANAQVPTMTMPRNFTGGTRYNVYSDRG